MSAPKALLALFASTMLATPLSAAPLALVYRGPAGCEGCSEAVAAVLETSKYQFKVEYVGPNEPLQLNAETLKHATLYAQPGGGDDVPYAAQSIGAEGLAAVRDFVASGGRYFGVCMGAYLASAAGFGVIDGQAVSYVGRPGSLVDHDEDTVTPVYWRGEERWLYYQSGSTILFSPKASGVNVLARYPNNDIAASVSPFGAGRVGLVGPHPEADQTWYDAAGLVDPDGHTAELAQDLLAATMDGARPFDE
ncbi:BPL-N domain-containing protein [Mesorhizobium sp. KR1-2]|uniref:BPL-N domain-containing protein n=1 Tax=Mesorhizobium sp. KR1-2 TaxID=3156609 RepID=UPI0032B4D252